MTDTAPSGCRWGWFGTTMMSSMPYTALSSKGTERRPFPRLWAQQLTRGRQSTLSFSLYQNTFIAVFKLPFLSPKSLATLTSAGQTLTLIRTKPGVGYSHQSASARASEAILRQMPHPAGSAACGTDEVRARLGGAGPVITGLRKLIHHLPPRLAFQAKNLHTV